MNRQVTTKQLLGTAETAGVNETMGMSPAEVTALVRCAHALRAILDMPGLEGPNSHPIAQGDQALAALEHAGIEILDE